MGEYTDNMDYCVGSRVLVKLYSGKVVEAETTAIDQSAGRKLQIVYGKVTASINPAQITEVVPTTWCLNKSSFSCASSSGLCDDRIAPFDISALVYRCVKQPIWTCRF
jgi:hypothetical protein